jgi:hypothetical protein
MSQKEFFVFWHTKMTKYVKNLSRNAFTYVIIELIDRKYADSM